MASRTDAAAALAARLARLQGFLQQDPDNLRLLADVADAQIQLELLNDARTTLGHTLTLQPTDPQARYGLAVVDLAQQQLDDALRGLQSLMAQGHGQPAVRWTLARCLAALKDWPKAREALASPGFDELPEGLLDDWALLRIRATHHCGDIDAALDLVHQWQALCGERGLPLTGRAAWATLLLDAEQTEQAAAVLAQCPASDITSNAELASVAGYVALADGQGAQALASFRRSRELQPMDARAALGEGLAAAVLGQSDLALQSIRTATQANPSHLGSWHALAWMQLLDQDIAGAEASIQAAMAQDDTFGESHGALALIHVLRDRADDARSHLRTALRLNPRGFNAMVAQWMLAHHENVLSPQVLAKLQQAFEAQAAQTDPALGLLLKRWRPQ